MMTKGERLVSPKSWHAISLSPGRKAADLPKVMNELFGVLTYDFAVFDCFGEGIREPQHTG